LPCKEDLGRGYGMRRSDGGDHWVSELIAAGQKRRVIHFVVGDSKRAISQENYAMSPAVGKYVHLGRRQVEVKGTLRECGKREPSKANFLEVGDIIIRHSNRPCLPRLVYLEHGPPRGEAATLFIVCGGGSRVAKGVT